MIVIVIIVEEEGLRRTIIWHNFELRGVFAPLSQVGVDLILFQAVDFVHTTVLVFAEFGMLVTRLHLLILSAFVSIGHASFSVIGLILVVVGRSQDLLSYAFRALSQGALSIVAHQDVQT